MDRYHYIKVDGDAATTRFHVLDGDASDSFVASCDWEDDAVLVTRSLNFTARNDWA